MEMPTTPENMRRARDRWVAWVKWYMAAYPEEVPTRTALAKKLGVSSSAITALLANEPPRFPSFETLVLTRDMIRFPIDALLFSDPPAKP